MDRDALTALLEDVRRGEIPPETAADVLARLPFVDIGVAKVDHHRALRQGTVEAVYAPGKTVDACVAIVGELLGAPGGPVLLTRAADDQIAAVLAAHPTGEATGTTVAWRAAPLRPERVVVVTAGTADLPVATECVATLSALGFAAHQLTDVGVAGIHRLLAHVDDLTDADAVVVVAGMEGALASVVGGIVSGPVVAVPTSVGYGAGLEGVTALLGMLASCAAGLSVVGIDNGFGAAMAVSRAVSVSRAEPVHRPHTEEASRP